MNDSVCHTPIPTIFALSSGLPPAAIAVVRISGPLAGDTLQRLAGKLPSPRRGSVRTLRDPRNGVHLDHALVLWFPGPATATGEDRSEEHTSELQSLMRISYAVFCLKKKKTHNK